MKPKLAFSLIIAVLLLIFLAQNTQEVTLRLYFWRISMPQIVLIPVVMVIGFVSGFVAAKLTGKGRRG